MLSCNQTESLRAISDAVFSNELQNALNLESISFSQLGRKLNQVPTAFFQSLFLDLVTQIHEKTNFERGQLEVLIDDKSCMYVFDRGYLDYERFDRMTDEGYYFVSRLRKNAVVRVLDTFPVPEDSNVLSDKMVAIGTTQNRSENVFRRLKLVDTKGNELVLITNRFDLDADEIAEIYKSRWAIELFFKWIKQHLSIKKFYGHSDQAVYNQVYLAMIVYCLHVLAQLNTESNRSYLQISRLLKASLWKPAYIWQHKIQGRGVP